MFEGIIGQTFISCNHSSRGGIDNLATEVDAGNAISSMSIQPVSDTNVPSSASMLLDSVDESNLGLSTPSSTSTLSDVVPIQVLPVSIIKYRIWIESLSYQYNSVIYIICVICDSK